MIRPEILRRRRPTVIEIGVLDGGHSRLLLDACLRRCGKLVAIDPAPGRSIENVLRFHPLGRLVRATSLVALPQLINQGIQADVVIVDGDHNYYTVLHELLLIDALLAPSGVVFLDDVGWPYGRRDLYYAPERIPPEARHPYARKGIVQGQSELVDVGGINPALCHALSEGGPRNGVRTAVEDFVIQSTGGWSFNTATDNHGLGILRRARPDARDTDEIVPPLETTSAV